MGSIIFGQNNKAIKAGNIIIDGDIGCTLESGSYSSFYEVEEISGSKVNILNVALG
jgi:hypothetical protein